MNLNKYHGSGRQYTPEEARYRALKFFQLRYVASGYRANPAIDPNGLPIPQATVKPYTIGRNAAKRAANARRTELWRLRK